MNAKTKEAIKRHGESLLLAFPNATEKDPIALCKKLRRIETATNRVMTDYCNGDAGDHDADLAERKAITSVEKILGPVKSLFINRDPRGCSLKLNELFTKTNNDNRRRNNEPQITTDWGGYGLIAPDLTNI